MEFKGQCKGVRLVPRGTNDNHICFEILSEDDENWFISNDKCSSHWIDELIEQLQAAKKYMETQEPVMHEGRQYGFNFKEK